MRRKRRRRTGFMLFSDQRKKYSAQQWRDDAIREIDKAFGENLHPVVVGGTGLYLKALVEGLSPMPEVPPDIRAETMALQKELGHPAFHAALANIDPVMAGRLNPNDTQRLIRAYEVIRGHGRKPRRMAGRPDSGGARRLALPHHRQIPRPRRTAPPLRPAF